MSDKPGFELVFSDKDGPRGCGSCTLCCKLVPVRSMKKPANTRCKHQRFGQGCRIYDNRPAECRFWSCRWLSMEDAAGLTRPDRCHYVVDVMPDAITIVHHDTGEHIPLPVVQVWVDPDYPDAHKDPALRAYLELQGKEHNCAALIRFNSRDAIVLMPPAMTHDGQWHEQHSNLRMGVRDKDGIPAGE
jgi:hypothetical protein